jgi:membrane protein YqaA with SNARE-associated domain
VKHLAAIWFPMFIKLGGIGLLALGVLDSSFLFAPLGNDILILALVARKHQILPSLYYAAMSTLGSILGCLLVDLVFREAGEKGLDKHLPRKRLEYVKQKVNRNAAWALTVASLAPPPFPFTPFIMAASALEYPRRKLLSVVGAARMVRFTGIAVLGLLLGDRVLRWANNSVVDGVLTGLVILCVAGSIVSAIGWIRRSRTRPAS